MTEDLVKWLFEREAIFGLLCVVCITLLRACSQLTDDTFRTCFLTVVGAVLALNFYKTQEPKQ